ncbi:MAG: polysaccharide deacetylase family protein [Mariniblastus sp.]|nr:polysaccharide deacetylase family protein [Mariniblastus sp.]
MICLTGDLHHSTLRTGNQAHCDIPEIQVANRYLKMLEEANVNVTFFVSGKSFVQEWDLLKPICDHPLVEIGGHNYSCFTPELWHRASKKLFGSYNGPRWYETWDVKRTINVIQERTGKTIRCWRNHMYMHGPRTDQVLTECGIPICSDGVDRNFRGQTSGNGGLSSLPINVMPDHEHLYHAERTPDWVQRWVKRYNWSDDYGSESYFIEEWTERVLDELRQHERDGVTSIMIIHPITLYLCDRFKCFEKILDFISSCETVKLGDVPQPNPPNIDS